MERQRGEEDGIQEESGVWTLESGVYNLETGVWNLEPGVWSLSPESEIWSLESGVCGLRLAMGDLASVTQVEVNLDCENTWFSQSTIFKCQFAEFGEGRIRFIQKTEGIRTTGSDHHPSLWQHRKNPSVQALFGELCEMDDTVCFTM